MRWVWAMAVGVAVSVAGGVGASAAAPEKSSKPIDVCSLVSVGDVEAALGESFEAGVVPRSLNEWAKPNKVVSRLGMCVFPKDASDASPDVSEKHYRGVPGVSVTVTRYRAKKRAARSIDLTIENEGKGGVEVTRIDGVGEGALFRPAQVVPNPPGASEGDVSWVDASFQVAQRPFLVGVVNIQPGGMENQLNANQGVIRTGDQAIAMQVLSRLSVT